MKIGQTAPHGTEKRWKFTVYHFDEQRMITAREKCITRKMLKEEVMAVIERDYLSKKQNVVVEFWE